MFDLGWSEMAIIMLVALVVIGPKDLPRMARTVGQWVAKGRAMAREFQRSLEEMAREAELDDVKREIENVGRTNISKTIEKTIDPGGELSKAFDPNAKSGTKAKEAEPASNGSAGQPSADKPASSTSKPATSATAAADTAAEVTKPAAKRKTAAKPRSAAKPRATTAAKPATKAKTTAKPRTRSTAKAAAKPKAAKPRTTRAKPAAAKVAEAETIAEPS